MNLTPEQEALAASEGWFYASGYVHPKNSGPFISSEAVVRHLSIKAETSEFHRDLYLQLPWMPSDNLIAKSMGWWIYTSRNGHEAVSYNPRMHDSQEAVEQYIRDRADAGDVVCQKVISKTIRNKLLQEQKVNHNGIGTYNQ